MIRELIMNNRSYRRFDGKAALDERTLRELVELARYAGSGANLQPLKYMLSWQADRNAAIFEQLAWAGYLTDWPGPAANERPTGYIVILHDTRISKTPGCDHGIAAQTIMLGAVEKGLGGCMIGSVNRAKLAEVLKLPSYLEISLVLALGKPVERVVLEDVKTDGSIKYYRDASQVHHVPKRALDELIVPW